LDSAGVACRAGRDLDRSWGEGNAFVGGTASADDRATGQGQVRDEDIVAGRAVVQAGQRGAALGQATGHANQDLSVESIGADDCQVERNPIGEAAARVLGFDVHGVSGRAAARVDAIRVEHEGVAGITDGGEVSATPDCCGEGDIVSASAQVGQGRARR